MAAWNVGQRLRTPTSVAGGATVTDDVDLSAGGADLAYVTVKTTATEASRVSVKVLASTDDGETFDTSAVPLVLSLKAGQADIRTVKVDLPIARISVSVEEGSVEVESWYALRQFVPIG